jgi:ribonuclease HI
MSNHWKFSFNVGLGRGRKNWSKFHVLVDLLKIANEKGVSKLQVQGDSNLVIELLKVYFRMKKITLRPLLEHILVVVGLFEYIQFHHVKIEYNQDTNKL